MLKQIAFGLFAAAGTGLAAVAPGVGEPPAHFH